VRRRFVLEAVGAPDFVRRPDGGGVVVVQGEEGRGVEVGDMVFF